MGRLNFKRAFLNAANESTLRIFGSKVRLTRKV